MPINKEEERYKTYGNHRNILISTIIQTAQQLDKAILTLSAGAFGVSLIFLRQIIPIGQAIAVNWLIKSWIFFTISILSTLFSFYTSQWDCSNEIRRLDFEYLGDNTDIKKEICWFERTDFPVYLTTILNISSIVCFVFGVYFLAKFGILNL